MGLLLAITIPMSLKYMEIIKAINLIGMINIEKSRDILSNTCFNPALRNLDNKILKKVFLPKRKNIKWVKDSEMGLRKHK